VANVCRQQSHAPTPPQRLDRQRLCRWLIDAHTLPSLRRPTHPVADGFLAAAAQEIGAAVIHYDGDYDTLAEVMAFESIWLAPAACCHSCVDAET
jgi:hypothetical protein